MKVSVIVPVFGVENYIEQCAISLFEQSFKDIDYIFVDDCSPDSSIQILQKVMSRYPERNSYVKIIKHNKNTGSVGARKTGYKYAEGEYLAFVDSDDWLEPIHIERLLEVIVSEDADIAQSGYYIDNNGKETIYDAIMKDSHKEAIVDYLSGKDHAGLWRKLIRKSFFDRNARFPIYDYYEDMFTTISLFMSSPHYISIAEPTYHYRYNPDSMTNDKAVEKRCKMYHQFINNMIELDRIYNLTADDEYRKAFFHIINSNKRHVVFGSINRPDILRPLLDSYRESYSISEIHNKLDAFYWMASRFGILWPWKYRSLLKFI